jgi:L-ascorbate metabolism protein UlaG (beta-lactamase superfamily)
MKFLGINGFEFTYKEKTMLLDPYISRVSNDSISVSRPNIVQKHIKNCDYTVIGHSHYDHAGDLEEINRVTSPIFVGSETTMNMCRYFNTPESRLVQFENCKPITLGPFKVTPIPSLHKQPMATPGEYISIPDSLASRSDFPEGGTWALKIEIGELVILNLGSANLIEDELKGMECDYLLVGIAGRDKSFCNKLLKSVKAKNLIPCHWDNFKGHPLEEPEERISVSSFVCEIKQIRPDQNIIIMNPLDELNL